MKAVCVLGSPRPKGNTATILNEIERPLKEQGIDVVRYCLGVGCKIVFKTRALKNQPRGYRVTFSKLKNNKALFWMEIFGNTLLVKANLLHIDDYADKMSACSDTIKKSITATKECENCSPNGCGSLHMSYHIDNVKYTPCYFNGHYFSQMDKADWNMLIDLIALENNIA